MKADYEIIIEPSYVVYAREKYTALMRLHTLWQDYQNDYHSGDMQIVTNGWHGIMAMVQVFRDRDEWDENKGEPKPFFKTEKHKAHKEIQCFFCHCQCTWDEDAFGMWDGECPACGTMLDPSRKKEAA